MSLRTYLSPRLLFSSPGPLRIRSQIPSLRRIAIHPSPLSRPIHSSSRSSLRQSYFPKPSRSSSSSSRFNSFRRRLDGLPGNYLIYGLIGLNVGVFAAWQYGTSSMQRFRDPALYLWLSNNFVVSEANLAAGRIWTLITSCFSHADGTHIFVNMLGLYFIGPTVAGFLGNSAFLALYLTGGVIASLTSLGWHRLREGSQKGRGRRLGHEGASGAIYSALAFYAATFPYNQIYMFMVLPIPAWAAVGGIFAYDLFSSIRSPHSTTDSAGHVGGILAGVGIALASRGRLRRW